MRSLYIFLALFTNSIAHAELLLYSDENSFHGCLDCTKYDQSSICNKYGQFGSKYSHESIWNKYGIGSKFDQNSPFNKYGNGLVVVDNYGNNHGQFSIGYSGSLKWKTKLDALWTLADGDYEKMNILFCELNW